MALAQTLTTTRNEVPYRVMVVDDSAVIRGLLARILEADDSVDVVAAVSNGEQAIRMLGDRDIEVIVLDIEMPVMDGITALPKLLEINPAVKIIMASTLTQRNAQISFKALAAGASDYIPKPSASRDISGGDEFKRDLRGKVRALGQAYRSSRSAPMAKSVSTASPAREGEGTKPGRPRAAVTLRNLPGRNAEIIAIGSSTGGPQALLSLLRDLPASIQVPIVITQHMPPTFTTILAEHIQRASGRACAEAKDGEVVKARRIYLAPGNWHMVVKDENGGKIIRLTQAPPVNFCRPAVDPMFQSVAEAYDGRVLAVVLTGMGQDGLNGGKAIVDRGGAIIAQDEESSVVWGMPGAVAMAGICKAVLPLNQLPGYLRDYPKKGF